MNNIVVKCFREDKSIPLPKYSHKGDACCDLYAKSIKYDEILDRFIVHTGLHVAIPDDYEIRIRPRSSLTKTDYYIPNAPGTIDAGYRGEIIVIFKCRDNIKFIDVIDCIGDIVGNLVKEDTTEHNDMVDASMNFKDSKEQLNFPFKEGDRIAQMSIHKVNTIEWEETDTLDDLGSTERGDGGFGSTGK